MYLCVFIYTHLCPDNLHQTILCRGCMASWTDHESLYVLVSSEPLVLCAENDDTRQGRSKACNTTYNLSGSHMSNQVGACCVSVLQARRAAEDCFVEGGHGNWIKSVHVTLPNANQYCLLSNLAHIFFSLGGCGCLLSRLLYSLVWCRASEYSQLCTEIFRYKSVEMSV